MGLRPGCEPFLVIRHLQEWLDFLDFGFFSYENIVSEWSELALSWLPLMTMSSWLSVSESLIVGFPTPYERAQFVAGVSIKLIMVRLAILPSPLILSCNLPTKEGLELFWTLPLPVMNSVIPLPELPCSDFSINPL